MANSIESIGLIARRLIQFESRFAQVQVAQRKPIAEYVQNLAQTIATIHLELQKKRVPHDPVRRMALLASQLLPTLQNEIGQVEAERLHSFFMTSCDTEKLCRDFQPSNTHPAPDEDLEKAVILLYALSNGLFLANNG